MNNQPYFPPIYGTVDCSKCEATDCSCRGKYQRSRRDFTHTSGRCPRLPDRRGLVEKNIRKLYEEAFPLVHAQLCLGGLQLSLTMPGQKRSKKIYRTRSGHWYFRSKDADGYPVKQALYFEGFQSTEEICAHMEQVNSNYCVFRCELPGYTV